MTDVQIGGLDADALRRYANRILELRAGRREINDDMKEVFGEAKDAGFVPAMLRGAVREMEMDPEARATFFATQDTYRHALGMLADTPLGEAAMERATVPRPSKTFAEQPIARRAGRPRKTPSVDDALARARDHLGEAAGTA